MNTEISTEIDEARDQYSRARAALLAAEKAAEILREEVARAEERVQMNTARLEDARAVLAALAEG